MNGMERLYKMLLIESIPIRVAVGKNKGKLSFEGGVIELWTTDESYEWSVVFEKAVGWNLTPEDINVPDTLYMIGINDREYFGEVTVSEYTIANDRYRQIKLGGIKPIIIHEVNVCQNLLK